MSSKKPFVEPKILADTDLETAGRDFPLMPLLGGSPGFSDTATSPDGASPGDEGFDPQPKVHAD